MIFRQVCSDASDMRQGVRRLKRRDDPLQARAKLEGIERKTASISADFDGEDVERQVKRMKKRIDEIDEAVSKLGRDR